MMLVRPLSLQPIPPHAKEVFAGHFFHVFQWEQPMYDGSTQIFEKLARQDTVSIIAVTSEKKILLTHQEQPGVEPFTGLPGGVVDTNETHEDAAARELVEETGYATREWDGLRAVQPYSRIDWCIYIYIAKGCKKVREPHLDAGEKIQVEEVGFDEFVEIVKQPTFRDKELSLYIFRLQEQPGGLEEFRERLLS